jgi:hypothetical protein
LAKRQRGRSEIAAAILLLLEGETETRKIGDSRPYQSRKEQGDIMNREAKKMLENMPRDPKVIAAQIKTGVFGSGDDLVKFVRSLRERSDQCELNFVLFLRGLEESGVWRTISDAGTYEKFLERTSLCSAERYRQGVRAYNLFPVAEIEEAGMAAAKITARIEDPAKRTEVWNAIRSTAQTQGFPVSERTASHIARPAPSERNASKAVERLLGLERENSQLRAEVDRLRALVQSLGGDPDEPEPRAVGQREKGGGRSRRASARTGSARAPATPS